MNFIIAREGWPFIGAALALFMIAVAIAYPPLVAVTGCLAIFVAWFFRNPERTVPEDADVVVSPADGRVIAVDSLDGGTKICIFMSVFNVHVNRVPVSGVIKKIDYNKGKFFVASKDKASLENEQNSITMEDPRGRVIRFVQIAGLVARRIVCHIGVGDSVRRGERFGMIRFGSRLDVYLPEGFVPKVRTGDKVKAGASILGGF